MSFQKDNYVEETHPLFRLLQVEAFRLVIVRYNHYSLVTQLKADLQATFPERPFAEIDAETTDYRTLVDTYYQTGSGFFYIQNFRALLNNPELYAGLNQRRDKLAQYPIAIIAFVEPPTTDQFAVQIMEKMPDLWSFRSLLLDLYKPIAITDSNRFEITQTDTATISTIGGSTQASKEQTLAALLNTIANTPETEIAYLITQYQQVAQLQMDLSKYHDAIATYDNLIAITRNNNDKVGFLIAQGDAYKTTGQIDIAITKFEAAKTITDKKTNQNEFRIAIERLGDSYTELGEFDKALEYYEEEHQILQRQIEIYPNAVAMQHSLARTFGRLGDIQTKLTHYEEALTYFTKSYELAEQIHVQAPNSKNHTAAFAITLYRLGETYKMLGNLSLAFSYFEKCFLLSKQLFEENSEDTDLKILLAFSYQWLGSIEVKLGNTTKAINHFQNFFTLSKELITDSPENIDFASFFASNCIFLGDFYEIIQQDKSMAIDYYKMAETTYNWVKDKTKNYKLYEPHYNWVVNKLQTLNP